MLCMALKEKARVDYFTFSPPTESPLKMMHATNPGCVDKDRFLTSCTDYDGLEFTTCGFPCLI